MSHKYRSLEGRNSCKVSKLNLFIKFFLHNFLLTQIKDVDKSLIGLQRFSLGCVSESRKQGRVIKQQRIVE